MRPWCPDRIWLCNRGWSVQPGQRTCSRSGSSSSANSPETGWLFENEKKNKFLVFQKPKLSGVGQKCHFEHGITSLGHPQVMRLITIDVLARPIFCFCWRLCVALDMSESGSLPDSQRSTNKKENLFLSVFFSLERAGVCVLWNPHRQRSRSRDLASPRAVVYSHKKRIQFRLW